MVPKGFMNAQKETRWEDLHTITYATPKGDPYATPKGEPGRRKHKKSDFSLQGSLGAASSSSSSSLKSQLEIDPGGILDQVDPK
jgi:hypothetical protein